MARRRRAAAAAARALAFEDCAYAGGIALALAGPYWNIFLANDMTQGIKVMTIDRSIDRSIDVFTGFHRIYAAVIGRQVKPVELSTNHIT